MLVIGFNILTSMALIHTMAGIPPCRRRRLWCRRAIDDESWQVTMCFVKLFGYFDFATGRRWLDGFSSLPSLLCSPTACLTHECSPFTSLSVSPCLQAVFLEAPSKLLLTNHNTSCWYWRRLKWSGKPFQSKTLPQSLLPELRVGDLHW